MTTQVSGRRAGVQVVFPPDGGVGYSFDKSTVTDEFEKFKPLDEQMDFHEKLRLFYVACTRARDHLVVSLHRKARKKEPAREQMTAAELLSSAGAAEAAVGLVEGVAGHIRPVESGGSALAPFDDWRAELETALTTSSRRRAVAATQIALAETDDPGLQKLGRNLDLPPWKKGRYGTAIGRAVHGLLQTIDLQTGAGLDATAAAQAQSEGAAGHEVTIARLAAAALASPTVREAAGVRHWRELFVAVPLGDRLLEGYVDLLYERSDGLVVVDYKTDAWADEAELEAKLNRYRLQGASYATAVQRVTGRPVTTCRFLFLSEQGAVARDVPDLAVAVQEVERAVPTLVGGGEAGVE
jgi:ATP-dependent exoDNAse (exonuclease V) beta subunit